MYVQCRSLSNIFIPSVISNFEIKYCVKILPMKNRFSISYRIEDKWTKANIRFA